MNDQPTTEPQGHAYSPAAIVPIIDGLLHPTSVIDYGCNQGWWLAEFAKLPDMERVLGYDRIPWDQNFRIPEHQFTQADFEKKIPVPKRPYDLALSLENAEHLNEARADDLIDALCNSPVVLFSAATPGQGGEDHLNEQPHAYWHAKFAQRGFLLHDCIRWCVDHDEQVYPWYRNNTFLYSCLPLPRAALCWDTIHSDREVIA